MSFTPELTIGIISYLILQVLIFSSSKDKNIARYEYTNLVSMFIWSFGIIRFLERLQHIVQKVKNPLVRTLLYILFVFITVEGILTVWNGIEILVLKWMPDAATYVLNKVFGSEGKVWKWPFVLLLWGISSDFANYANNADRYIAYYQQYFNDQEDVPDTVLEDGGDSLEQQVMGPIRRRRSKYTHYTRSYLASLPNVQ